MILQLNQTERDAISFAVLEQISQVHTAMYNTLKAKRFDRYAYDYLEHYSDVLLRVSKKLSPKN